MVFLRYLFIIICFSPFMSDEIMAFTNNNNKKDTIVCSVIRQNILFVTDGKYHPFSVQLKNYGYFEPLLFNDIKYGFYKDTDSQRNGLYINPCISKPNTILFVPGDDIYINKIEIDTIYNYFTGIKKNTYFDRENSILDTFLLSRELEYSFLLKKIGDEPLIKEGNHEQLRIIYVKKYRYFVKEMHSVRIEIKDESARIFLSKIDTENSQDFKIMHKDDAILKRLDLSRLRRAINDIDFQNLSLSDDNYCCESDYSSYRKYVFLIEYTFNNEYYYTILCAPFSMLLEENIRDVHQLSALMINFSRRYFRRPFFKRN